jgi:hypothetical protein
MKKRGDKDLSYAVKGTCFDVHNALGPMLPEKFYQVALAIASQRRGDRREISRILRLGGEKKENLCTSTN